MTYPDPKSTSPNQITLIADSGATDLFVTTTDAPHLLSNIKPCIDLEVLLPNGEIITSTAEGVWALSDQPKVEIPGYVFADADLKHSLLGLAALTNEADCTITLDKHEMIISKEGQVIARSSKEDTDKLWQVVTHKKHRQAHGFSGVRLETDGEYVAFAHESFGSPVASTFIQAAAKGWLGNYPRLTSTMISAHRPHTVPTAQGHLDQTRQGIRSTKPHVGAHPRVQVPPPPVIIVEKDTDMDGSADPPVDEADKPEHVYLRVVNMGHDNHTDGTGRIPTPSMKGNKYVLVSVYDGYIKMQAHRDRSAEDYVKTYTELFAFMQARNKVISVQRLDNEKSSDLEELFKASNIPYQYVPPHCHRALKAERAIRSAKNHIIATWCTADPEFPMSQWDELLEQAEISLNHLRGCTSNLSVSAYEGMYGKPYDFLAHPIAPPGMRIQVHEKPTQRATWGVHGVDGFYLGPALDHYRCWRTYITRTQSKRISDTIAWFPTRVRLPGTSKVEALTAAIRDVSTAITQVANAGGRQHNRQPYTELHNSAVAALTDIANLLTPANDYPQEDDDEDGQQPPPLRVAVPAAQSPPLPWVAAPASQPPPLPRVAVHELPPVAPVVMPIPREQRARKPTQRLIAANQAAQRHNDVAYSELPIRPIPIGNTPIERRHSEWMSREKRKMGMAGHVRHIFRTGKAYAALNLTDDGRPLTYRLAKESTNAKLWEVEETIELRKLMTTATINPQHPQDIPADRIKDITYYNPQVSEKMKDGKIKRRVRGTIGGDRVNYPGEVAARTAEMEVVKLLLNSVLHTEGAKWMTADITDFYLNTPLERKEYLRIQRKFIPDEAMQEFGFDKYMVNGSVLFEVNKGMYGLPQAGLLAQKRLIAHLATADYHQCKHVPCLFEHTSNGTQFTLVVDDFGIKYSSIAGAQHLLDTLAALYPITSDWTGNKYLGITTRFEADSRGKYVSLSMPGYVAKQLLRFKPAGTPHAASPSIYTPPVMGRQNTIVDTGRALTAAEHLRIQAIVGAFLFYSRAVDPTMLTAVNDLASPGGPPTERMLTMADRLLAYAATYPSNELRFYESDMKLEMQSDASYLSRSNARSVAGGLAYLVNEGGQGPAAQPNGAISAFSKAIDVVVASVGEAEYAGVFKMAQHGAWLRVVLEALRHPQAATELWTDNECAEGLANDTLKIKRSKSIDMRFHWVRDRIKQGQFIVKWQKGEDNLADFFTKALPVHVHQEMMSKLVYTPPSTDGAWRPRARRVIHDTSSAEMH